MASKNKSGKRELIDTGNDKRDVRRDEKGHVSTTSGRSLHRDVRSDSKITDQGANGRYVRRDERGRWTEADEAMFQAWSKVYENRGSKK